MVAHSSRIIDSQFSNLNLSCNTRNPTPQLSKNSKLFILLNARSIRNKTEDIDLIIKNKTPSLICITETWANQTDPSFNDLSLSNFRKVVAKRKKDGGGLAILAEPNLVLNQIDTFVSDQFELICVDIKFTTFLTIRLILVYRTPSCSSAYDAKLIDFLERLSTEKCIILGDFNLPDIDWSKASSKTTRGLEFIAFFRNFNYNQLVIEPTRMGKFLDLVFSNYNLITNTIVQPGISDHELVEIHAKLPKRNRVKPYTKISTDKLSLNKLDGFLFSHLDSIRIKEFSIDKKYERMQEILQQGIKQFLKTSLSRKENFISNKLKHELQYKLRLWKLQKQNPFLHSAYIEQVKKVKLLVRLDNENTFSRILSQPKRFFTYLRTRLKIKHDISDIELEGKIISNDSLKAEAFATKFQKYFSNDFYNVTNWVPPAWANTSTQIYFSEHNSLTDLKFDVLLVNAYLKLLSNKFNTTPDEVPLVYIKNCDIFFSQFACDIFRLSLDSSLLPEVWKLACIIPIFKRRQN